MKRYLISSILFMHFFVCIFSQKTKNYTKQEIDSIYAYYEFYDILGLSDTTVPVMPYIKIRNEFFWRWLYYRMPTNPRLKYDDWYNRDNNIHRDQFTVIIGDTVDRNNYALDYTVKRWPDHLCDCTLQKSHWPGYYLVEKKGNNFVRRINKTLDPEGTIPDTIKVHAHADLYPYDERFLFYYDREKNELRNISGNLAWNALPFKYNLSHFYALTRLAQYNVGCIEFYDTYIYHETSKSIEDERTKDKEHTYLAATQSSLTQGSLLIKGKKINESTEFDDQIEMIYYTNQPSKTGDSTGVTMLEYHYTIKPHVEKITERYPVIRKLTWEENMEIRRGPMRFFIEWYFPPEIVTEEKPEETK